MAKTKVIDHTTTTTHIYRDTPLDGTVIEMPPAAPTNDWDPNPMASARWKHRRRMAYTAMTSIILLTSVLLTPWVPVDRVHALEGAIEWFYLSMSGVVGAYMGMSTWASLQSSRIASYGTDGSQPVVANG